MTDASAKETFVNSILDRMSIEDKIGQCMTFEFCGTRMTSATRRKITELRCGGLRVTPHIYEPLAHVGAAKAGDSQRRAPWAGPAEYAGLVNELQALAMARDPAIPLHISLDREGDLSANFGWGGTLLLPNQMGLTATGDIELAREGVKVVARQLRAIGVNMLHGPCVDIDFMPNNPSVGVRAFADTAEAVATWGIAMVRALTEEGVIATAKHFPGRGFSTVDTHYGLDSNERSLEELMQAELYPYRMLFEAGVPAIMPSHTMYKALDPDGVPASASKRVHEFTRRELGYNGVMATDDIGMAGVLKCFENSVPKAVRGALVAGNDLVLIKTSPDMEEQIIVEVLMALDEGELSEGDLDDHVRRVLRMKMDAGLFDLYPVDAPRASDPINDSGNRKVAADIARRCCTLLCDDDDLLPLKPEQTVLCVEPYYPLLQSQGNDYWWHSDMLQEFMSRHAPGIESHEVVDGGAREEIDAIVKESEAFDVTVVVCQKFRGGPSSSPIAEALIGAGRKVVVLSVNPYETTIPPNARCVLVTYGMVPLILRNAADVLYGNAEAEGVWPLANYRAPVDRLGVFGGSGEGQAR